MERKPFEPTKDYTKVPNAIYDLYTRIPEFKADHALLYVYLMAQYNVDYGYAFPDTWDIATRLNCGESKVSGLKKTLVDCGLVEVSVHPTYGNDVYFVKAPITEETAFYVKFPLARVHYEKRKAAFDKRRESGSQRKRAFDERVKAQKEGVDITAEIPEVEIDW